MHVTYGFVFYYTIFMIILNLSLILFLLRGTRRPVFNMLKKLRIGESQIVVSIIYISYAIIFVILADSIWSYFTIRNSMDLDHGVLLLNDYSMFESSVGKRDYVSMFKRQREFYMA